jgi:hypothetical protein
MNRLQRAALLTELADKLQNQGSWCGETHIQKAAYFLVDLLRVPVGLGFILYKHGPFSFELRDELTAMRADGLLELRPREPYGPTLAPTPGSAAFRKRYPVTLTTYQSQLDFVTRTLASKGVAELERLATALYVTRKSPGLLTIDERAARIHEVKPHVSLDEAKVAVAEIDRLIEQADALSAG